jgi:hypothetical protein
MVQSGILAKKCYKFLQAEETTFTPIFPGSLLKKTLIMAKKLLFTLLVYTLSLSSNLILAGNDIAPLENTTIDADVCDAPAPDSFRVTSNSTNGVNLAWITAWSGATHTLVLSLRDGFGNWNILNTFYNVPGSTYTIPGLGLGSYKITNATNCITGETSFKFSEVEFKNIELTTSGRIPANPVPINACEGININNYHWVGFSVSKQGTAISTLFEVTLAGQVKRVGGNNQIVAVDGNGFWPVLAGDVKKTDSPFLLVDLDPLGPINIGKVIFMQPNWNQPIVKLCKDESPNALVPWKTLLYSFTALTATATLGYSSGFGIDPGQGSSKNLISESIKVENPIKNNINVFVPQESIESGQAIMHLMNANGQLLSEYKFDMQSDQLSFPVEWLNPGIYFLKIKTDIETITLKIIKPE